MNVFVEVRSVAIVGASSNPNKTSGRPVRYLREHGFKGDIWPINPGRDEVQELKAFKSLDDLPARPDIAFIALDTDGAMSAVASAADMDVPLVSVLASGFSESGEEGQKREAKLLADIKGHTTRLLGPNSIGLVRPSTSLICTANAAFAAGEIPSGNVAVISQSGSAIGTFVSRGRASGIGFSALVSVGNEADHSVGSVGMQLVDDPETDVFILFLESIKHLDDLRDFARAAEAANKQVLVYKIGRSEVGAQLAVSHTGAMVSSDTFVDALFKDLGFIRFDVFEAVFEGAALFSRKWLTPNNPSRSVSIVSTTGGGGALVADRLGSNGISVTPPSETVRSKISEAGVDVGHGPLIDLTLAGTNPSVMGAAIAAILDEEGTDAAIAVIGSSAEHFPELAVRPIAEELKSRRNSKPLAVFTVPHAKDALVGLAKEGISAFRTPEACADAVTRLIDAMAPREPVAEQSFDKGVAVEIDGLPERASEREALDLFDKLGVSTARRTTVPPNSVDLSEALEGFAFPVVLKVVSSDLPHKSEYGGVKLHLMSVADAEEALREMRNTVCERAPKASIEGFMLQEQRSGVAEAIVGFTRDASTGPMVTIGTGGVLAEVFKDVSVRCAPLSKETALAMMDEVKGLAVARGFRGGAQGDLDAFADLISKFSQLACYPDVVEAEINPTIIDEKGKGVCAVDGLLVKAKRS